MCSRVWRAWRARCSSRSSSLGASSDRQIGIERHLRVDHHELAAGRRTSMSGRSGPSPVHRALLEEVAVGDHPRHLDDVAQLDLAPGPARGGSLQRRDEVAGLLSQRAHPVAELADHLRELALGLAALALETSDLALHPRRALLDGADEPLDLLGASRHLAGRALLLGSARVGEPLRERVARLREHVDRDRLHCSRIRSRLRRSRRRRRPRPASSADDQHQALSIWRSGS